MSTSDSFLLDAGGLRTITTGDNPTAIEPPPDDRVAWIHLVSNSQKTLGALLTRFAIHPLTIEDLVAPNARIKSESFPHYTFLTFRGLHLEGRHVVSKNFHFIIFGKTLISVSNEPRNTINDLRRAHEADSTWLGRKGADFVLHHILDVETDHTLGIVRRIDDMADDYETRLFSYDRSVDITAVYELRNALQTIKKMTLMQKEVFDLMQDHGKEFFREDSAAFFRDVRDHAIKALDIVDSVIQSINGALEAYITLSTRRTNEIIRVLTVMTAIMLPMTLITGIYGMNFEFIPLLKNPAGFWTSVGLMLGIGAALLGFFRWKNWL